MKSVLTESKELQVYQCLLGRMNFSHKDKIAFYNVKKGNEGEKMLFRMLKKQLRNDSIALYDLLLDNGGSFYQIDCLLLFQNQVIMIEVKNHSGEYEFRDDQFYCITTNKYYQNPLHQLQRSTVNLLESFPKLKAGSTLQSYVIFVNQEFTLFSEKNPTIILPSQINSFIQKINQSPGKISANQRTLSNEISAAHIKTSPYTRLPAYQFEKLRKGVLCRDCRGLMRRKERQLICLRCTYKESTDSGVLRNVLELTLLFPEMKITTGKVAEWCAIGLSNRTYRRILKAYLQQSLNYKYSYFHYYS